MCENGRHVTALRKIAAMRCAIAESSADWTCRSASANVPEAEWCAVCIAAAALEPAPEYKASRTCGLCRGVAWKKVTADAFVCEECGAVLTKDGTWKTPRA